MVGSISAGSAHAAKVVACRECIRLFTQLCTAAGPRNAGVCKHTVLRAEYLLLFALAEHLAFGGLAVTMVLTRHTDWRRIGDARAQSAESAATDH